MIKDEILLERVTVLDRVNRIDIEMVSVSNLFFRGMDTLVKIKKRQYPPPPSPSLPQKITMFIRSPYHYT